MALTAACRKNRHAFHNGASVIIRTGVQPVAIYVSKYRKTIPEIWYFSSRAESYQGSKLVSGLIPRNRGVFTNSIDDNPRCAIACALKPVSARFEQAIVEPVLQNMRNNIQNCPKSSGHNFVYITRRMKIINYDDVHV